MIDISWCKKPATIKEAEKKRMIDFLGIKEEDVADHDDYWQIPILPLRLDWKRFKMQYEEGMELFEFSSPPIGDHQIGGYAWIRDNIIQHYIIVR